MKQYIQNRHAQRSLPISILVSELHVISGALHSFYEPHEQEELEQLLKDWIRTI